MQVFKVFVDFVHYSFRFKVNLFSIHLYDGWSEHCRSRYVMFMFHRKIQPIVPYDENYLPDRPLDILGTPAPLVLVKYVPMPWQRKPVTYVYVYENFVKWVFVLQWNLWRKYSCSTECFKKVAGVCPKLNLNSWLDCWTVLTFDGLEGVLGSAERCS